MHFFTRRVQLLHKFRIFIKTCYRNLIATFEVHFPTCYLQIFVSIDTNKLQLKIENNFDSGIKLEVREHKVFL